MTAKVLGYILVSMLTIMGLLGGMYWYQATNAERKYRVETERFELIVRHDAAQIRANQLREVIQKAKAEEDKKIPVIDLSSFVRPQSTDSVVSR